MPPDWVQDFYDYRRWLTDLLDELGAFVDSDNGILHVTEVRPTNQDDRPAVLMIMRDPEQRIAFWTEAGPTRTVIIGMTVALDTMAIEQARFVLRDGESRDRDDNIIMRLCRDDTDATHDGPSWHLHDGAHGDHEPRPDIDDWDLDRILHYLKEYPARQP